MVEFNGTIENVGLAVDALGVFVIVAGIFFAFVRSLWTMGDPQPFRRLRNDVGRGILLGLEFLVAADIIRTVAVEPTLKNVTVLGMIVLIRTFLSIALEVELEGRWPWRSDRAGTRTPAL